MTDISYEEWSREHEKMVTKLRYEDSYKYEIGHYRLLAKEILEAMPRYGKCPSKPKPEWAFEDNAALSWIDAESVKAALRVGIYTVYLDAEKLNSLAKIATELAQYGKDTP